MKTLNIIYLEEMLKRVITTTDLVNWLHKEDLLFKLEKEQEGLIIHHDNTSKLIEAVKQYIGRNDNDSMTLTVRQVILNTITQQSITTLKN